MSTASTLAGSPTDGSTGIAGRIADGSELPAPIRSALDGQAISGRGVEDSPDSDGEPSGGGKAEAKRIIQSIGRKFVENRQQGRSLAWAELEDELMTSAHILISEGMMSAKDWIGISRDIEDFRKQETGTQVLPADFLANWLSTPEPDAEPIVRPVKLEGKRVKKTGKKAKAN